MTARFSNRPCPRRNRRSFGSGQKPPCLIHRPKKKFFGGEIHRYPLRHIKVRRSCAVRHHSQRTFFEIVVSKLLSDCLVNRNPLPRPHPNSESNRPVGLVDGRIFLRGVALPFFDETFAPNDFAISTVRSVEPESTTMISPLPSATSGFTLCERAADVGFFVEGDDDDGEIHRWNAAIPVRDSLRTRNCLTRHGAEPRCFRLTRH